MSFSEGPFLVFFLITYFIFTALRNRHQAQIYWLLGASLFCYGYLQPRDLYYLLSTAFLSYFTPILLSRMANKVSKRILLSLSILAILGPLLYFKYWPLIQATVAVFPNIQNVENVFSISNLPLGISFFTFQALSYLIDCYWGRTEMCRSASSYFLYLTFFPQLVAGPIERMEKILPQIPGNFSKPANYQGGFLIFYGLTKKIIFADYLGSQWVDPVFANPSGHSHSDLLLAIYAYAGQIFLDFSAYSDMAVGIARFFSIELTENFSSPYKSANPSDFWRRWHITLSTWFRDYVYIPLGGNRGKTLGYRLGTILATMFLCGLWHGANWTFIVWGLYHGLLLMMYRIPYRNKFLMSLPAVVKQFAFFQLIALGWIFFRAQSLSGAFDFIAQFLQFEDSHLASLFLILLGTFLSWSLLNYFEDQRYRFAERFSRYHVSLQVFVWVFGLMILYYIKGYQGGGDRAFIYFQF